MKKLHSVFIEDSAGFLLELEEILSSYDSTSAGPEILNNAFRIIHSLKSEAAYLGFEEIATEAHEIESVLDEIRNEKIEGQLQNDLFEKVRSIRRALDNIHLTGLASETDMSMMDDDLIPARNNEYNPEPVVNDFEKRLLREALERDEVLYKLVCEIEDDAPLKHPKLYLIINNLEQIVNVIAYSPSLEKINNDFSRISVILTTLTDESDIYKAVNIDQIKKIQLAKLDYSTFLSPVEKGKDQPENIGSLRVETAQIDKILSYLDELKIRLHEITKYSSTNQDIMPRIRRQISSLGELSDGMEFILKNIRMVRLGDEFKKYPSFVRDLADKLGKKAELIMDLGQIRVDRRVLDLMSDPITHLLRNAVDHGLEHSEERKIAGKAPVGKISLTARQNDGRIIIEVADDGRGIDSRKIYDKALELGLISGDEKDFDILTILTEPGFSTSEEITEISGRGIGLDLVYQKIKDFASAEFSLLNWPGEGTAFILSLPGEFTVLDVLIVRCGEKTIAVPSRNIASTSRVDKDNFSALEDGKLCYKGKPVFTVEGRLYESDSCPDEEIVLEIDHLEKTGYLLADESLFSQQIAEDQMTLLDEGNPFIYSMVLAGRKTEYAFLNPSIIL